MEDTDMERYLVESHHTSEDCHHVMEQFIYYGLINNIDWGCEDGVHTGWAIVDVENKDLAMLIIPPFLRSKARVIRLVRYSPEKIQAVHQ
jgi:hypothetical protein